MRLPHPQFFARIVAFLLVHCCSSAALAGIERAIITKVVSRGHHSHVERIAGWKNRIRIQRARRRLYRTIESWQ